MDRIDGDLFLVKKITIMIDPNNVHLYDAPKAVKEEFLLFCLCVAGKTAITQAKKLDAMFGNMLTTYGLGKTPFELVQAASKDGKLRTFLEDVKLGQYNRLTSCFYEVSFLGDIDSISLETLENIKGIGPKTARFFLLYTRRKARFAVFDTHILKWMAKTFPAERVPKSTPPIKRYKELENLFLNYCDEHGLKPENIDLEIWKGRGTLNV